MSILPGNVDTAENVALKQIRAPDEAMSRSEEAETNQHRASAWDLREWDDALARLARERVREER